MSLSPKAQKLILLLMDGAVTPNEQETATRKLVDCLRKEYVDGYALLADWNKSKVVPPPPPTRSSRESPYGRFIFPFGKHRGEMLKDIPVSYLLWVLDLPDLYPRTRTAIEKFLEQQN